MGSQTEVLASNRELITFDRAIKIIGITKETHMVCVYDSGITPTLLDLLRAMYANAKYSYSGDRDIYKKLGVRYEGEDIYDRSWVIPNHCSSIELKLIIKPDPDPKSKVETKQKMTIQDERKWDEHIFVKMVTGKTLKLPYFKNDLVIDYKRQIESMENISLNLQRLLYGGKQLYDYQTLESYGISNETTLHLVLKLSGGMYTETSGRNGKYKPINGIMFALDVSNYDGGFPDFD